MFLRGYFVFQHHISLYHPQIFAVELCLGFVCFILLTASALKENKLLCTLEASSWVRVVCVRVNAICGECLSVVLTVQWCRKKEHISSL